VTSVPSGMSKTYGMLLPLKMQVSLKYQKRGLKNAPLKLSDGQEVKKSPVKLPAIQSKVWMQILKKGEKYDYYRNYPGN